MKALSIRQPWAWAIIHAGKDVENRDWPTNVRGRVLIHASKTMTVQEYYAAAFDIELTAGEIAPDPGELQRGGIIGSVEIVDLVTRSNSRWYSGPYGFVLRDPKPLPFRPLRGRLGFFEVREA